MTETNTIPGGSGSPPAPTGKRRPAQTSTRILRFIEAYALLIGLVLIALFFSVWSETSDSFLTSANIRNVLASQTVIAVIALGALIPLVCYEFDLSVGAVTGLSAVLTASAMSDGTAVPVAIAIGVLIGAGVGTINAILVTRVGINGVITTLGVETILGGVVIQKTGGLAIVSNIPRGFTDFGASTTLGIPTITIALIVIALAVYFLLNQTSFGRQIYALGSNREAASLVGLRTRLILGMTFVLAGVLSGIAGILYVARAGGTDPSIGDEFTLPALAAAFLSAAVVKPGQYNVGGTLIAIFFLAVLNNGLNLAGAQPYVASYVNGAALIVGVALAAVLHRRRVS